MISSIFEWIKSTKNKSHLFLRNARYLGLKMFFLEINLREKLLF